MTDPPPDTTALLTVPALLSVTATATVLGCSPRTVRRRIDAGAFPAVLENGRTKVRADDLGAYIERLERVGVPAHRRPPRPRRSPYPKL